MSLEILTVVALWCGQPIGTGVAGRLPFEVDDCRRRIMACVAIYQKDAQPVSYCFQRERLERK